MGRLRRFFVRLLAAPLLRFGLISDLLDDPGWKRRLVAEFRARQIARADFDERTPAHLDRIRGFEDCYWLFECGQLNISLSQLQFDEAADLYRRIADLETPRVAELGRFKGGTTLLLAASGACVLSLDNDATGGQSRYDEALERAARRFGLVDRVEAVVSDALDFPIEPASFDLVLLHCSPDYELAWALFRRWWPAVKPGGAFLFHATPELPGEVRMVEELSRDGSWPDLVFEPDRHGDNLYARKVIPAP